MMYFHAVTWLLITGFSTCSALALNEWSKQHDRSWHRKYRSPYVLGISLFILSAALIQYLPKEKELIAVSPPEVKLTGLFDSHNHFRGYTDLLVYNRGDDPYYQIWVKILIESEFLSADTIDLDFPTLEGRIKDGDEPHAVMVGASCMGGKDKNSKKAFLCVIESLAPKKSFQIKMTSSYNTAHMSDEEIGKARIVVSKFENYPAKTSDNFPGGETAAVFEVAFPNTESGFTSSRYVFFCADVKQRWSVDQRSKICTPNSRHQ